MHENLDIAGYEFYKNIIELCKKDTFEEYLNCIFDALYAVTRVQDYVNLKILGDVRENTSMEEDEKNRLLRRLQINDAANAIILNIAQTKGHPDIHYLREKRNTIDDLLFVEPLSD